MVRVINTLRARVRDGRCSPDRAQSNDEPCSRSSPDGRLILVSAERERDFPQKLDYLPSTGESVETPMVSQMEDFTSSRAFRVTGPTAFAEASITH